MSWWEPERWDACFPPFYQDQKKRSGCWTKIKIKVKIKVELFKEVLGEEQKEKVTNLKTKEMLMLSVNTTITVGTVEKISDDLIEMNLNIPIVALKGDNVGVARNINGHWRLIGFGEIVD